MDEVERPPVVVARVVGVIEATEDAERDVQRRLERNVLSASRRRAHEPSGRGAVDVLHRHVQLAVVLAEGEHLDDVRVREPGADARLVDEHRDEVGVLRQLGQDAFHRDDLLEAVRPRAAREVHLRHPSRRDPLNQLVGTEHERGRMDRRAHRR